MNDNKKKIKLLLHHNYLQITKDKKRLQLPIRCAKLIHDMYEARNHKNEDKDIKHYTEDYNDFEYEVSVFQMNAKYNSDLLWNTKIIKPFKQGDD